MSLSQQIANDFTLFPKEQYQGLKPLPFKGIEEFNPRTYHVYYDGYKWAYLRE